MALLGVLGFGMHKNAFSIYIFNLTRINFHFLCCHIIYSLCPANKFFHHLSISSPMMVLLTYVNVNLCQPFFDQFISIFIYFWLLYMNNIYTTLMEDNFNMSTLENTTDNSSPEPHAPGSSVSFQDSEEPSILSQGYLTSTPPSPPPL